MDEPSRILGFLEVSLGEYTAALTVLQRLLDDFDPPRELEIDSGGHLPDAVEALVALGQPDRAEKLVDALETHGARRDRPWMSAVGARGRAALHMAAVTVRETGRLTSTERRGAKPRRRRFVEPGDRRRAVAGREDRR